MSLAMASPGAGRAVYPTILEVSFICLLLSLATCKVSSSQEHKTQVGGAVYIGFVYYCLNQNKIFR